MTEIYIRFYLLEDDIKKGEEAAKDVCERVDELIVLSSSVVAPYWKISEHLEVAMIFSFKNESDLNRKIVKITSLLGNGWLFSQHFADADSDEKFAIWNIGNDKYFYIPKTQWAIVELYSE
jgi:hypothetical protein